MSEPPAVAYQGGVAGYAATQPANGKKIDPDSPDVSRYVGYLTSKHDNALAGVGGGGKKAYSYSYAFNGFAAALTEAQAAQLATQAGVLAVVKDEARQLDTSTTQASKPASAALASGFPRLPPTNTRLPISSRMRPIRVTVVLLPLVPVTA